MCVQTRTAFLNTKEMILRDNQLFSLLICEIYNTLTYHSSQPLTPKQIFDDLSPFLQSRIHYVTTQKKEVADLFPLDEDVVGFVVALLSTKIDKIKVLETEDTESYYCA
ncbi:MAG TPA: hypothetical protein DCY20_01995 [Firmicutes bacterium]|nr:hypothetical protein [Bacillota bacterium]